MLRVSRYGDSITIDLTGEGTLIRFRRTGQQWVKSIGSGDGTSLTEYSDGYKFRDRDGTETFFGTPVFNDDDDPSPFFCQRQDTLYCEARPLLIIHTDGKTETLQWESYEYIPGNWEDSPPRDYFVRLVGVYNQAVSVGFSYKINGIPSSGPDESPPPGWSIRTGASFSDGSTIGYAAVDSKVRVTDQTGAQWYIASDSVQRPGETQASQRVTYSGRSVSSVVKDGVTTSYNFQRGDATATMTRTDADGRVQVTVADRSLDLPISDTVYAGGVSVDQQYSYDSSSGLAAIVGPDGRRTEYERDAWGNVTATRICPKSGTGEAPIVTTAGYADSCDQTLACNSPLWTRDAANRQTDYSYDPVHGGLLTETRPAPIDGAPRLQIRYVYTDLTERKLLSSISSCRTQASCAGTADETVTDYAYDNGPLPSSVTVRAGDGSVSATTHYTYTPSGDVASADGPCPVRRIRPCSATMRRVGWSE